MTVQINDHSVPVNVPGDDVCATCGRVSCDAAMFLASKPIWAGDIISDFREYAEECEEAAADLGARYAELWKAARVMVRVMDRCEDVETATDDLAKLVGLFHLKGE